jgi:hypothetical protein
VDGHVVEGEYRFTVTSATEATNAADEGRPAGQNDPEQAAQRTDGSVVPTFAVYAAITLVAAALVGWVALRRR